MTEEYSNYGGRDKKGFDEISNSKINKVGNALISAVSGPVAGFSFAVFGLSLAFLIIFVFMSLFAVAGKKGWSMGVSYIVFLIMAALTCYISPFLIEYL